MISPRTTLNVLFYIKKSVTLKDGRHPIFCRITVSGTRAEFSVNRTIDDRLWNQRAGKSDGKDHESRNLNSYLDQLKASVFTAQTELLRMQTPVTSALLKNKVLGLEEKPVMLLELYDEHNRKLKEQIDRGISKSTHTRHVTTRSHLSKFIHVIYGIQDIPVREVGNAFIRDFDHYLRVNRKCNNNSAIKYQKNFKKITKYALDNGWIGRDPFTGIRFRFEKTNKPFLNGEELGRLMAKRFDNQRLRQVRDVFVFCCHTGLAFVDVKNLVPADLKDDPSGKTWIEKPRQKTGVMAQIPLLPNAREIINRYRDWPATGGNGYLLPVPSNQKMNAYLKEIADLCDIEKVLTTHVARHTFATTIALGNNIPMEVIAKVLGHSSTKETRLYAVVEKELIGKAMGNLLVAAEMN